MSEDQLSIKAREALRHIRNYLMHNSKLPSMRILMSQMNYKSPRSAMLLIDELIKCGFIRRKEDGSFQMIKDLTSTDTARTVDVPLVGNVTCGIPILAEENIQAMIPVSTSLIKNGSKYFLLRAVGDSMNQAGIDSGDIMLIKQQPTAENGQRIVALIDDEATVKEFHHKGDFVTLIPRSSNPKHKPIILEREFKIQGIVEATIPGIEM
jgi:repressor LexA